MRVVDVELPKKVPPLALGAEEARRVINVGRNEFYRLLASGEIRGKRVGRKWIIPVSELERWLQK